MSFDLLAQAIKGIIFRMDSPQGRQLMVQALVFETLPRSLFSALVLE